MLAVDRLVPEPDKGIEVVMLFDPLCLPLVPWSVGVELTRERLLLTLPLDVGAKVTLKLALCPVTRVSGSAGPLRLNPDPVIAA